MSEVRVRFAPSPTGNLHVGSARTAVFNWLFARHHKGGFILRIEDTDKQRSKPEFTEAIFEGMRWLGMDWDEGPEAGGELGPYFQSKRLHLYHDALEQLVDAGKVYHCFCTPERLQALREAQMKAKQNPGYDGRCRNLSPNEIRKRIEEDEKFVLRIRVDENESVEWYDLCKENVSVGPEMLDDIVVAKSDGFPTYNFAVVVDDWQMKISHVIRGEDHLSNTPKQILVYRALGLDPPNFAHIPMILGSDRSKMSKRHGAVNVIEYEKSGFLSDAFFNFMALLGWSPSDDQEIFSREELVSLFSLDRVASHGAIFDGDKLKWMNGMYIRTLAPEELLHRCEPFLEKNVGYPGGYGREDLTELMTLFRERLEVLSEITDSTAYFFQEPEVYDEKGIKRARKTPDLTEVMNELADKLEKLDPFTLEGIENLIREMAEQREIGAGKIIHPTRLAVSGRSGGPGLFEMMKLLGRGTCVSRLRKFSVLSDRDF